MNNRSLDSAVAYIDTWLALRYEQEEMPGFSVTITHDNQQFFHRSHGFADKESGQLLKPRHMFRVASHSKPFTATAIMQLQEANKLRIDDTIVSYLPWLKDHADSRWKNVTIRQLLSHGAGVMRDGRNADFWQVEKQFLRVDELTTELLDTKLIINNNQKLKYSNLGYSLLGLLVEQVSGQRYNEYVAEHIIEPLKLRNTIPDYSQAIEDRLATGYTSRAVGIVRLPIKRDIKTHAMSSATGFCSNTEDLSIFFAALTTGTGLLLNDESKKEMQRMQYRAHGPGRKADDGYGLGLELGEIDGANYFAHSGGFPGYSSLTMAFPQSSLVISVAVNTVDAEVGRMSRGIYSVINYFQNNPPAEATATYDYSAVAGRYKNLMGIFDLVTVGDDLVVSSPSYWFPFYQAEKLERIDDMTFRIGDTDSYASEGESVVIIHDEVSTLTSMNYAGVTMLKEKDCKRLQ